MLALPLFPQCEGFLYGAFLTIEPAVFNRPASECLQWMSASTESAPRCTIPRHVQAGQRASQVDPVGSVAGSPVDLLICSIGTTSKPRTSNMEIMLPSSPNTRPLPIFRPLRTDMGYYRTTCAFFSRTF